MGSRGQGRPSGETRTSFLACLPTLPPLPGCAGEQQVLWKSAEPSAPGGRVDSAEPGRLAASLSFRCGGRCGARPITGLFLRRGACGREQEVLSEWGPAGPPGRTLSWGVEISAPPPLTGRGWGLRQPPPAGTRGQRSLLGPTPTGSSQHRELPHYLGGQPGTPAWGLRGREMKALGLTSW